MLVSLNNNLIHNFYEFFHVSAGEKTLKSHIPTSESAMLELDARLPFICSTYRYKGKPAD